MGGKVTHPYHLVNPSIWPLVTSFSMLAMVIGAALSLHKEPLGHPIMFAGLGLTILFAILWWRDVIKEGFRERAHTHEVARGLRSGMALFIVSEIMFFFQLATCLGE